jgi:hypothetical protein
LSVARWNKRELRMADDHGWRCKPGYTIFVVDRGAVRFDIPESWVVQVDAEGVKIHDKRPPDDDARLQLTVFYPPPVVDWTELPLATLLADSLAGRGRKAAAEAEGRRPEHDRRALLRGDRDDPLAGLADDPDDDDLLGQDPISHVLRPGLEIVWTEVRRLDPEEKREARHRHLVARGRGTDRGYERDILPFVTMDFWPEDAGRCNAVWRELVRSLRVGQYVADPRKGPRRA